MPVSAYMAPTPAPHLQHAPCLVHGTHAAERWQMVGVQIEHRHEGCECLHVIHASVLASECVLGQVGDEITP
jgi:hypothetical protein